MNQRRRLTKGHGIDVRRRLPFGKLDQPAKCHGSRPVYNSQARSYIYATNSRVVRFFRTKTDAPSSH